MTIGITCFNAERTIQAAIDSALAQERVDFEVIVYDDCSSDGSVALIEAYERRGLVRLIRGVENLGYPSALNRLVSEASGEYVAFFDDDDISTTDRLIKQIETINHADNADSHLVLCYSSREVSSASGKRFVHAIGAAPKAPSGIMVAEYILLGLERPAYSWGEFGSCAICCRKTVFEEVGPFDVTFRRSAEWDFAIRAALKGAVFVSTSEALVEQRLSEGGSGEKSSAISLHYALKLHEKHAHLFPNWRLRLAGRAWIRARAGWARGSRVGWRANLVIAGLACPELAVSILRRSRFRRLISQAGAPRRDVLRGVGCV